MPPVHFCRPAAPPGRERQPRVSALCSRPTWLPYPAWRKPALLHVSGHTQEVTLQKDVTTFTISMARRVFFCFVVFYTMYNCF